MMPSEQPLNQQEPIDIKIVKDTGDSIQIYPLPGLRRAFACKTCGTMAMYISSMALREDRSGVLFYLKCKDEHENFVTIISHEDPETNVPYVLLGV